jgi:hypothetical protein
MVLVRDVAAAYQGPGNPANGCRYRLYNPRTAMAENPATKTRVSNPDKEKSKTDGMVDSIIDAL